jgi:hypothetical protein
MNQKIIFNSYFFYYLLVICNYFIFPSGSILMIPLKYAAIIFERKLLELFKKTNRQTDGVISENEWI